MNSGLARTIQLSGNEKAVQKIVIHLFHSLQQYEDDDAHASVGVAAMAQLLTILVYHLCEDDDASFKLLLNDTLLYAQEMGETLSEHREDIEERVASLIELQSAEEAKELIEEADLAS